MASGPSRRGKQQGMDPLFELPDQPVERSTELRKKRTTRSIRPRWTRYRSVNRVPCDECVMLLHEAGGVGPYARTAQWKRVTPTGDLVLCHAHAEMWRAEDKSAE